jgi:AraC-like DNA-binding protein
MTNPSRRRRIDWGVILPGRSPPVTLATPTKDSSDLAALTAELAQDPSPATADRVLRQAVEFSRAVIQFERVGIYVLDEKERSMLGTWGTDARCETVDEHALAYEFGPIDREVFARAQAGFPWTVYENCPQIAQWGEETQIIGRGWVACTAIMGQHGPLGMLFNDTATTHAPVDEAKQARGAILCSLLGRALDPFRALLLPEAKVGFEPRRAVVRGVTKLLVADPTLSCDVLAKRLNVSTRQLTRTFKQEAKLSIVDYRNELRLTRFLERVDARAQNLLEAVLESGFGSYAQFHRVFRARFGQTPRDYLVQGQGRKNGFAELEVEDVT